MVRTLSRERAKDSTLDYDVARERFAERRGIAARLLDTALGRERATEASIPAKRDMFAGLRLSDEREAAPTSRSMFDGLRLGPRAPVPARGDRSRMFEGLRLNAGDDRQRGADPAAVLGKAVERYARAHQDIARMTPRSCPRWSIRRSR